MEVRGSGPETPSVQNFPFQDFDDQQQVFYRVFQNIYTSSRYFTGCFKKHVPAGKVQGV